MGGRIEKVEKKKLKIRDTMTFEGGETIW